MVDFRGSYNMHTYTHSDTYKVTVRGYGPAKFLNDCNYFPFYMCIKT
jgi:hypothetical protein